MRWPTKRPRLEDVSWLAGLFEGEGSFSVGRQIAIGQKDREVLDRVQMLFGGRVVGPYLAKSSLGQTSMHRWYATGERGRGICRTIYHLLTERRKAQARLYLEDYIDVSCETVVPDPLTAATVTRYLVDFRDLPEGVLE